ncbi:MAG: M28 family peptidase [Nitrospirae bacterium]|nr:MAG: M28 family peptidase [Nitrospirota bacterium]
MPSPPTSEPVDPRTLPISSDLAKRLSSHVAYLASPDLRGRRPGTPGNQQAAQYIRDFFVHVGLEPLGSLGGYTQSISPTIGDNLIGVRRARTPHARERWVLVGAHYDHLGATDGTIYPGADDNASAVAILLETACVMAPLCRYSLAFVAFNAEEPPFIRTPLMGSQYFVDHLPAEMSSPDQFQAVLIMDLMGGVHWVPLCQTVFVAGAEQSPPLYRHVKHLATVHEARSLLSIRPIGMHVIEQIPLLGRTPFSDYDAFRNAAIPYAFFSSGRTPRYHQPTDLPDTIYYERMAATVWWFHDLLHSIDQDDLPYTFDPHRIEFADELATFRPLIAQAANWDTRIPGTSYVSWLKLRQDAQWAARVNPSHPTQQDITRLERASLRMQCLLADIPVAFLL